MLASNGAFLLIDKPTRMFGEPRTLIDHIVTNDTSNIIYPCMFFSDISDHFPVACLVANNSSFKNGRSSKNDHTNNRSKNGHINKWSQL